MVMICLSISLPRLLQGNGTTFIFDRVTVGWAFLALALLLAVTCSRLRLRVSGRLVSSIGFAMFVTLAWDAWIASSTSSFISLVFGLALLGEAAGLKDD